MLGWAAREMPHAEGNAEKYCVCVEDIPKIIVTTAEGHQEVYDPGSKLEAMYGTTQRDMMSLAGQWHSQLDAGFPFGALDEIMFSS